MDEAIREFKRYQPPSQPARSPRLGGGFNRLRTHPLGHLWRNSAACAATVAQMRR